MNLSTPLPSEMLDRIQKDPQWPQIMLPSPKKDRPPTPPSPPPTKNTWESLLEIAGSPSDGSVREFLKEVMALNQKVDRATCCSWWTLQCMQDIFKAYPGHIDSLRIRGVSIGARGLDWARDQDDPTRLFQVMINRKWVELSDLSKHLPQGANDHPLRRLVSFMENIGKIYSSYIALDSLMPRRPDAGLFNQESVKDALDLLEKEGPTASCLTALVMQHATPAPQLSQRSRRF